MSRRRASAKGSISKERDCRGKIQPRSTKNRAKNQSIGIGSWNRATDPVADRKTTSTIIEKPLPISSFQWVGLFGCDLFF
jgi:hypothetical protein